MLKKFKKLLAIFGPGFITGASDDDPSGIATYAQTGALFGYHQLWTALFTFPFQAVIQEMCGRIGLVTGKGLAGVLKKHYSKPVLYIAVFLLVAANTANIGADLGAMAAAAQLVIPIPFVFWLVLVTIGTLILEIFVTYKTYAKFLKYLTLSLFAYIAAAFIIKQDWLIIFFSTIHPYGEFSKQYAVNLVAVLGTTISPYLFFWQADEEVEEEIAHHKLRIFGIGVPQVTRKEIKAMRLDTIVGMFFSNMVMFFIIITGASTFSRFGISHIETADQAAKALEPLAGKFTSYLFATGIVGTGLLAVPILAGSASYALSEAFGWKEGLYRKVTQAHGFYGVITIATLLGLLVNFTSIKPFQMLYYTAVINGICAPILMLFILRIANNKNVMDKYTNSLPINILGGTITILMGIAALVLFLIR